MQAIAAPCAKGAAHTDSKDRTSRIDLAQLLEPDTACRVVIDDIGVIGGEREVDLSEEERQPFRRTRRSSPRTWLLPSRVLGAHSASSSRRNVLRLGNHRTSGSRIDETPDVSDLCDVGSQGPTSEQQAPSRKGRPGRQHQGRSSSQIQQKKRP